MSALERYFACCRNDREEEDEEYFTQTARFFAWELIVSLSRRGLNPIKLAYSPSRSDDHRQSPFCIPTDGWPGWVGPGSLVEYEENILANGYPSKYELGSSRVTSLMRPTTLPLGSAATDMIDMQ